MATLKILPKIYSALVIIWNILGILVLMIPFYYKFTYIEYTVLLLVLLCLGYITILISCKFLYVKAP